MSRRKLPAFVDELKAMLSAGKLTADMVTAGDGRLSPSDRVDLLKLASNSETEQVWAKIEKSCGAQSNVKMRYFIRGILAARGLATKADGLPDYRAAAKHAESLAGFLTGSGLLPPPLPMTKALEEHVAWLKTIASMLRELAKISQIRKSRENVDGSRESNAFMQFMSLVMHGHFRRWFDNEVAFLTNVLFPQATVTNESVRATRRPTTKKGRSSAVAKAS